ncbi:hypothetical protein MKW94_007409 [Papaver nudicaule]|uniref:Uncharacterized protein n=1 Tax=Papaver nudicaule TaxID=74823 RepID=A0AA42AVR1_PAPNU|nr:hypothetical protein [Papaver nudicaule]
MKFIALLSLFLMCLVLSNSGAASAYECKKSIYTGKPGYSGPCQPHCQKFCKKEYNGSGECPAEHTCVCKYHSATPCPP